MPDDRPALSPADLYEEDFYLWTQAQAEALRAQAAGSNAIDWDNVAEEVEEMGRRDLRAAESLVIKIIEHFHKLRAGKRFEPRQHWKYEIVAFRNQLRQRLTRSLRAKLEDELEELHRAAAREAERLMDIDEPFFDPIDVNRRWTLAQILGEEDDPLPPR